MPCEHCLNRRDFIARAAGTAGVAALVAACGDGFISGATANMVKPPVVPPGPVTVKVGNYPELAAVGVLVQPTEAFVALKRTGTAPDTFTCFSVSCTHQGCAVDIVNGQRFACPCHGSQFDNNGQVTQGPAQQPLRTVSTSYDPATDLLTIG